MDDTTKLAKLVESSGFLFQLAVEEQVRRTGHQHGTEVVGREYPWRSPDNTRSGFIDFIADHLSIRCVFECKKTAPEGEWVFLVAGEETPTVARVKSYWSFRSGVDSNRWGFRWDYIRFDPVTYQSEFCIVRGSSEKDKPLLERTAADLVRSTESLGLDEFRNLHVIGEPLIYLPVIVTNAQLFVCKVDPAQVDLRTGELPSSAQWESVEAIRFRKALPTDLPTAHIRGYKTIREDLNESVRTVFVVQAQHLVTWLSKLLSQHGGVDSMPWPWHDLLP